MAGTVGHRLRRTAYWLVGIVAVLAVVAAVLLAMPVAQWRTGERFGNTLPAIPAAALPPRPERVWIDTDAACGRGERVDPDDCFAILHLAFRDEIELVGFSTVFGNAPLETTDRTMRELANALSAAGVAPIAVHAGAAVAFEEERGGVTDAQRAIIDALTAAPLTILALGPLTNVAAAIAARPDLAGRIERVVAVMGRRSGHVFHPSEGSGAGMLLGHGPIFRDFNVAMDTAAVESILDKGVPLALIPYEVARSLELDAAALDHIAGAGSAHAWVAERSRGWLRYWNTGIGRHGFYPFDLVAAAFVLDPRQFICAEVEAELRHDRAVFPPLRRSRALLVEALDQALRRGQQSILYCHGTHIGLDALVTQLANGS